MERENNFKSRDGVFSKKVRAGKRRTYFLDVRSTRSNDYYITITESKKRFDSNSYERHKLHLYKEDFNKFVEALNEVVDHVKQELMPEYDFDEFSKKEGFFKNHYQENLGDDVKINTQTKQESNSTADVKETSSNNTTPTGTPKGLDESNLDDLKW